jgi:ubiquinone biosynthesis protein
MRITSIPQLYRHVNRWREILAVLSKYGLADWLSRFDIPIARGLFKNRDGEFLSQLSREARIRLALEELGPTFIKLGQILSTRPDQVGVELANELSKLQCDVPADSAEQIERTIESELGRPPADVFATFQMQPVASASIGQVHRATLHSGESVAVKVQHDNIQSRVRIDLDILKGLALLAERLPELQPYRPQAMAAEFQRMLRRELDFTREQRHLTQFSRNFAGDQRIHVPRCFPELCTTRVLTLEWLDGIKLCDSALPQNGQLNRATIARNGADLYLEMIFRHGLYHADPHPGNLLVMPHDTIGLLDFGMVGRIDASLQEEIEDMLMAILAKDAQQLTSLVMRLGAIPPGLDEPLLSADLTDFVDHYGNQPLDQFDLAGALTEFIEITRRYHIVLPASLAMLLKVLVMLEGTAQRLQPNFSLMELIEPYRKGMVARRMSPLRQTKKLLRIYGEMEQLAEILPRRLRDILSQVQSGKFDVHLDHRGLEPSVNRLVWGMLTSSLLLGSALLLSHNVWPVRGVSLPGAIGIVLSGLLALRLMWAINKSGHLD